MIRLVLLGRTFKSVMNISDHRYIGLDANDVPILSGNLSGVIVLGHADHYHVTSHIKTRYRTVVEFSIPTADFMDAGSYRWYIFSYDTLQRFNLIVAGECFSYLPVTDTKTCALSG